MAKMRSGMLKSLEKRPVRLEALEEWVERICPRPAPRSWRTRGADSQDHQRLVMANSAPGRRGLITLCIGCHRFQDADEFREQLEHLDSSRRSDPGAGQLPLLPAPAGQGTRVDRRRPGRRHIGPCWRRGPRARDGPSRSARRLRDRTRCGCRGEGFHQRAGRARAEAITLAAAGEPGAWRDRYVTLEALPSSWPYTTPAPTRGRRRIVRVVYACAIPIRVCDGGGGARLVAAGVEVTCGCSSGRPRRSTWASSRGRGRPWARVARGQPRRPDSLADGESHSIDQRHGADRRAVGCARAPRRS